MLSGSSWFLCGHVLSVWMLIYAANWSKILHTRKRDQRTDRDMSFVIRWHITMFCILLKFTLTITPKFSYRLMDRSLSWFRCWPFLSLLYLSTYCHKYCNLSTSPNWYQSHLGPMVWFWWSIQYWCLQCFVVFAYKCQI